MLAWIEVAFVWQILLPFAFLLITINGESIEGHHKVCTAKGTPGVISIGTRRFGEKSKCAGCDLLQNCTTVLGSVHLKGILLKNDKELEEQIRFPRLKEITGHLIVTFLEDVRSLSDILPNLAVIRGRVADLFKDYALVVYQNTGLRSLGLDALTVVKQGGIKIEFNRNLCYLDRVRWESLMNPGSNAKYELSIDGNSKECYDKCSGCRTPSGHGSSGIFYCWGDQRNNCQRLCDSKCGSSGCEQGSQDKCCHQECLGGCTKSGSPLHCNACQHLRLQNGECVKKCPPDLKEENEFRCSESCQRGFYDYHGKCVEDCPAGYSKNGTTQKCDKCPENNCPKECDPFSVLKQFTLSFKISLLSDSAKLKGCTVIRGNLEIEMRKGPGRDNIAQALTRDLGSIEEVKGYVVVRQSSSLISLNFFKKLKKISPRIAFSGRYALAIFDNPNLESLWDFDSNFTITNFGVFIQLNPRLCLQNVYPLIDVLNWNISSSDSRATISKTTNGDARACDVHQINITVVEISLPNCQDLCVKVSWPNKVGDYRDVLFYSIWYRETTSRDINEYDDVDACNSDQVWNRQDVNLKRSSQAGEEISAVVRGLKAFTLYAFRVDAFVINKKGVKSAIAYLRTNETKPSPPLALQVNFLSSESLQVTWKKPFFPNGEITQYIVTYQERNLSYWWKNNIDWCKNQDLPRFGAIDEKQNSDNGGRNTSTCREVSCDCEKTNRRDLTPDKKEALFAKEFQDTILTAVFTKNDNSDNDLPKTSSRITVPTVASTSSINETNATVTPECGTNGKNSSCTRSTRPETNATSTRNPTKVSTTSRPPTGPPSPVFRMNTTNQSVVLSGLKYFTEYAIQVCACNSAGCGTNERFLRQCSDAVGRTDKNVTADDVGESLEYRVNNETKEYILTWRAPSQPNEAVLRYDVWIKHENETADIICVLSSSTKYSVRQASSGRYEARVRAITPVGNGSWSNVVSFAIAELSSSDGKPGSEDVKLAAVVGISLAAIVVLIIAFAVVIYVYMHKRYQKAKETGVLYASANPEYLNCSEVYIPDEWEVPRDKIKIIKELGNGSFGMVYEGEAKDILPGEQCSKVAVKTVSDNSSIRDKVEFLKEASIMKAFNCNHVVRLLGVVSSGNPVLVIMELMENGDLKSFLRSRRPDEAEEPVLPPPTNHELCQMAAEIADGMAYLADRKYVHRDLAARNCMVSTNFTCKIGDFGMARDVYETDYYRKGGKGFLPVRWMAPESLKDGIFASASDVWSFGVVLWEMVTLAEQPYQGKSNEEVMKYVIDGEIMDVPEDCPEVLFNLMMNCWLYKPKVRPSFDSIVCSLQQYVSEDFIARSFYHNQRQRDDTNSTCQTTRTEKDDLSESPNVLRISRMEDSESRESVV